MKIIFWNTKKSSLSEQIIELLLEEDADIAGFCESTDETANQVIQSLRDDHGKEYFFQQTPGCERIKLLCKAGLGTVILLNQHKYYSLIKVIHEQNSFILGLVHLPSKQYHSLDEIRSAAALLNDQVQNEEKIHSITHSLIIGDFNVDPFEMPMVSFSGMGATNSTDVYNEETVTRSGETKRLFFNPMWSLYSSNSKHPGSHRYRRLGEDVIHWHFIDQVIIRPSLIPYFDNSSLRIIEQTKSFKFRNRNGVPSVSDHLPITCRLEFRNGE